MTEILEKRCTKCGIAKPLTEFYSNRFNKKDGHRYRCKQCELTPPSEYEIITERLCRKCGKVKPIYEFPKFKLNKSGRNTTCSVCMGTTNIKNSLIYFRNNTPERILELEMDGTVKICMNCQQSKHLNQYNIRRYNKDGHSSYCIECDKDTKNYTFHRHKELSDDDYVKWRLSENYKAKVEKQRTKREVFSHYCKDGIVQCANPFRVHTEAITDLDILTLDHMKGDGYKEPKNRRGGIMLYRKLKQESYPNGFQVLCANCQFKKKVINNEYGEFSGKVKPLK
jgi:hypothetical protein